MIEGMFIELCTNYYIYEKSPPWKVFSARISEHYRYIYNNNNEDVPTTFHEPHHPKRWGRDPKPPGLMPMVWIDVWTSMMGIRWRFNQISSVLDDDNIRFISEKVDRPQHFNM